jgi:hypothetical protein
MIVSGHQARRHYQRYLEQYDIEHEIVWLTGTQRHRDEISCFWLKYIGETITRIAIGTFPSEGFLRIRGRAYGTLHQNAAFCERLIDLAYTVIFGPALESVSRHGGILYDKLLFTRLLPQSHGVLQGSGRGGGGVYR